MAGISHDGGCKNGSSRRAISAQGPLILILRLLNVCIYMRQLIEVWEVLKS
jgi:hypothetical protein